jgi:predicted nucleotidyltransferase
MIISAKSREALKREISESLSGETEVKKIMVFGSFLSSADPGDIDVAIFQDSNENYLTLAMKYRKLTRNISSKIPLDIIPIRSNFHDNWFLREINAGEVIYER